MPSKLLHPPDDSMSIVMLMPIISVNIKLVSKSLLTVVLGDNAIQLFNHTVYTHIYSLAVMLIISMLFALDHEIY